MSEQHTESDTDQDTSEHAFPTAPAPSEAVRALGRLVGTWRVTGGAEGEVNYAWMEGGYFLIQRVRLEQYGQTIEGIEIIGNLRPFGEEPGAEVVSRFYDSTGNTLDYVYEIVEDTLTIWAGEKGSPARYVATFDGSGDIVTGEWEYPGGGGYQSTMTRASARPAQASR
ncbi:MAG TPA: hypothetical protein VF062_09835 [Candidatus Limnocylindrales bacterium]